MVKRHRQNRQTPADYIPWGKPEEVKIVHVEAEKLPDGRVTERRYVERFAGKSSDSRTAHDTNLVPRFEAANALHHPNGCQGQPGIAVTWIRDGRTWCRADYTLRYGTDPESGPYRPPRRRPRTPSAAPITPQVRGKAGEKFLGL